MGQTSTTSPRPKGASLAPNIIPGVGPGQKSAFYWVGIKTDGDVPCNSLTIGGVTFLVNHTPWEGSGTERDRRGRYPGYVVRLTTEKREALIAALPKTVIRWRRRVKGKPYGQPVKVPTPDDVRSAEERYGMTPQQIAAWRSKCAQFTFKEGDEPAAKYLYCVRLDDPRASEGCSWRPNMPEPPSVLETGIEEIA